MQTGSIYHNHKENLSAGFILRIKQLWTALDMLDKKRLRVYMATFFISLPAGTIACAFAAFTRNDLLLALVDALTGLTLVSLILSFRAKWILLFGAANLIASVITIIYGIPVYDELIKHYGIK